jgi:hypothetical protein
MKPMDRDFIQGQLDDARERRERIEKSASPQCVVWSCDQPAVHLELMDVDGTGLRRWLSYCDTHWDEVLAARSPNARGK